MNMKHILRSVLLSAIGLALLGWISFWFTTLNAFGPDGESAFKVIFYNGILII